MWELSQNCAVKPFPAEGGCDLAGRGVLIGVALLAAAVLPAHAQGTADVNALSLEQLANVEVSNWPMSKSPAYRAGLSR